MKKKRQYRGPALEKGGTSTRFNGDNMTPSLTRLIKSGAFEGVTKILDYGAGKYGRNAAALRKLGYRVYAYDPFHGDDEDGWKGVSNKPPRGKFDLGFTSFVLNVVPEYLEKQIIECLDGCCKTHYHIVRDDLPSTFKAAIDRGDKHVTKFFIDEFATPEEVELLEEGNLSDDILLEFCEFGTKTSRGFQRLCTLDSSGLTPALHKRGSFRVYKS